MTNFAQRLIELRTEKNLSQNQLSKALNVSQASVSIWESGRRYPSVELLIALADFFECSTDYLLGKDN